MPYAKFQFKAGIDREGTDYTNAGGWFDSSLVRFRKGFVENFYSSEPILKLMSKRAVAFMTLLLLDLQPQQAM